jgi:hypothetical protein
MRMFLIPMLAPANGSGKGTRQDPWRPKYLRELGLSYSIHNARDFCLAEVWGDEKAMDELSTRPDVAELLDTDEAVPASTLARVEGYGRNMALAREGTGRELIASLRSAIHSKQTAEQPQRMV